MLHALVGNIFGVAQIEQTQLLQVSNDSKTLVSDFVNISEVEYVEAGQSLKMPEANVAHWTLT